ncbi:MAG: hypothetical protein Kow0042_30440 [Calditrichia bacterium]
MENIKRKIAKELGNIDSAGVKGSGENFESRPIYFISDTAFAPPSDVWETEDAIHIVMEIANLFPGDFTVEYVGGYLVIEGHRGEPSIVETAAVQKYHKKEIDYGDFRVKIKMNTRIDQQAARAVYKSGMLFITLPKQERAGEDTSVEIPVDFSED